jgi:hypothetical protein
MMEVTGRRTRTVAFGKRVQPPLPLTDLCGGSGLTFDEDQRI